MMQGMMAGMWIWTIVGRLIVVLLVIVIVKLLRKRERGTGRIGIVSDRNP
jgi:predicted PurR-regulated permease PerM